MNQKEIRELIEFLVEKDIAEFELQRGDVKLHIRRSSAVQPAPVVQVAPAVAPVQVMPVPAVSPAFTTAPSASSPEPVGGTAPAGTEAPDADLFIVKSPIVGTFYEAASPGAPPSSDRRIPSSSAVAFSPEGTFLACGCSNGMAVFADPDKFQTALFEAPALIQTDPIEGVSFGNDQRLVRGADR